MNRLINPLINPRKKATQIIYTRSFVIHINILYVYIYIYITYIHSNSIFRLAHSKKKLRVRIYLCRGHEKSITSILKKTTKFSSWFCKIGSYVILSEREMYYRLRWTFTIISDVVLTLTWGLTKYNRGLALSLSLSSICLRISSLLMLLRTLTSSLDSGAVAVNCIGWATSGSDFFRWRETAAAGIACTKKRNGETKRERWLLRVNRSCQSLIPIQMHVVGADDRPFV